MRLILTLALLLSSYPLLSQQQTIGALSFSPINDNSKPAGLLQTTAQVFEDNINNSGRTISLHIEVLPAFNAQQRQDPIFIIMGGPGQAASDLAGFFGEILQPLRAYRDIVFIDQRGTGKSEPLRLQTNPSSMAEFFADDFMQPDIIRTSRDALSQQHNLRLYSTLNAILDLEWVRSKMGYPQINIYGTSYGTRVAIAYINRFPSRVRTATLKGLVPPGLVIPETFAADAQRSLDMLLTDCLNNPDCNASFPDLKNEISTLFNHKLPATVEVTNPTTGNREVVQITRQQVALSLRVLLMSPSTTSLVPSLIYAFNRGQHDPLVQWLMNIRKSYLKGVYDGMTLSVICFEDYPRLSKEPPTNDATFLGNTWVARVEHACSIWNPDSHLTPETIVSKQITPVLILSGDRDAATPPANGVETMKWFPRAKHIVVPAGSHSFDGMRNCVDKLICDFIAAGRTDKLDSSCASTITFPDYASPLSTK